MTPVRLPSVRGLRSLFALGALFVAMVKAAPIEPSAANSISISIQYSQHPDGNLHSFSLEKRVFGDDEPEKGPLLGGVGFNGIIDKRSADDDDDIDEIERLCLHGGGGFNGIINKPIVDDHDDEPKKGPLYGGVGFNGIIDKHT